MAYVVARPAGRFEIRESLHTPAGPRSRSLANFAVLTEGVLDKAAKRASRPFDPEALRAGARRRGAPVVTDEVTYRRFVDSSRALAASFERPPPGRRPDPGEALIELLGFVDQLAGTAPPPPAEALVFPALSRLVDERRAAG